MKKLLMTLFMVTLIPVLSGGPIGLGICLAEEVSKPKLPDFPDINPVYDSYFNYGNGVLYIYGSVQYTIITVEVTHDGQTVVMDVLSPNDLPTQYDFNGCDRGAYYVTISAGNTLLTSFSFNLI